jgi:hypothetical protein
MEKVKLPGLALGEISTLEVVECLLCIGANLVNLELKNCPLQLLG